MLFPGIGDQRTLQLVSALAGDMRVPVVSKTRSPQHWGTSYTRSFTWRPRLPVDQVARIAPGMALRLSGPLIDRTSVAHWRRHPLWSTYAGGRTASVWSETLRPLTARPPWPPPAIEPSSTRAP